MPVPAAARPKAWVCGRSLAGIVSSNPAGGKDICGECCVWSGRGLCVDIQNYSLECNYNLNCGSTLYIAEEIEFLVLSVKYRDYITRNSYLIRCFWFMLELRVILRISVKGTTLLNIIVSTME